jgi:NarL family two-component system sensor histidine kinase YdfH
LLEWQKEMAMKQFTRSIHPLCWFLLIGSIGGWAWDLLALDRQYRDLVGLALDILLFILPSTALYWLGLTRNLRKSFQWLLLAAQTGIVLVMTQVSHDGLTAFLLSLVFVVATAEMFKQPRPVLLALGAYFVLLLLYAQTLGSHIPWFFLWRGDDFVVEIPALLILSSLVISLHQKRAHARTQALLQELNAAHAQLSAYALRVEELTMITERQRLARELHDTLTQGVAGLIMQLEAAHSYFGKGQVDRAHEIVLSAITRARTVLTETRYVLQDLRADSTRSEDLIEMVQEEIDRFTDNTGIPCQASLNALTATPTAQSGHVLRAISEVLANVARHAQANQVWICIREREAWLEIEIRDDGIGFDPATVAARPGHYGLAGLRERVRLIGGQLDIMSSPGQGSCISISVPISNSRRCA